MIIDFHTHIFPKVIRDNRETYFPSEPAFKLLYDSPKSKLVGAKDIIAAMDEQGVDRSVVFGFPWKDSAIFKMQNDYVMEAVARYPGRIVGLCCFDPLNQEAAPEARRCIEGGLSGIGEIAFYQSGIDDIVLDMLTPLMEICLDKDLVFLMHTNEPVGHSYPGKAPITLKQIYSLATRFPENNIVLAHWGGGIFFFNLLKKEVKERLKNIYFDTAASPFLYDPAIYKFAVEIVGADKILFGSDYPLLKPERYFKELESAGLTRAQMDAVSGLNAAKLLHLL
jgi:predicted TIM-barrel fold metal-dependent hydrolase